MSQHAKLHEQLNIWRNGKVQGSARAASRTVCVKGHEVLVTYKRRSAARADQGRGGGPGH